VAARIEMPNTTNTFQYNLRTLSFGVSFGDRRTVSTQSAPLQVERQDNPIIRPRLFVLLLILIVAGAILRSALATRLDDFTIDEAYHIAAGVSSVQRGDFRINPEHPPLVKLWVGSLMSATGFYLSAFREIHDKSDERDFTAADVFLHNDPDSVQRRARIAMWAVNGLLLIALAFALRRSFGPGVALGTTLFLAIDPTVAAHLPVVMTDLPIALLGATAVVLAAAAFRTWLWTDLAACSIALGLALGTKHSAPVFFAFLALTGAAFAILLPLSDPADSRLRRFGKLAAVLLGALILLWSFYFFHFQESKGTREAFNRPLANKIEDVHSPLYRIVLRQLAASHVVPRAYIWGFADTIRAGAEGRAASRLAFGRLYYSKVPKYFFPGVIALKLPIGLSVLVLIGIFLLLSRRLPRDWILLSGMVLFASVWFLVVLSFGSPYGGIRHALPAVVLLAIMGGIAAHGALSSNSKLLKAAVAVAFLAAGASALPVMRPWEYYNEIIGGGKNAYLFFNDEGIDLYQRKKEIIRYYREVLQPESELPYLAYGMSLAEAKARGFDFVGLDPKRDEARLNSPVWSGTIFIGAQDLAKQLWWDHAPLREAAPVARLGNLFVLRGTFDLPSAQAETLYFLGLEKLYAEKPDLEAAERFLKQSAALDPTAFFVNIELGNVRLKRGSGEEALRAYTTALQYAPNDPALRHSLEEQIRHVTTEALEQIPPLRNPRLE
jgi:tetratricopeptide (TPR) repeat protein